MKFSLINSIVYQLKNPSISTKIAYASFVLGTLLFVLDLIFENATIFITGIVFVYAAFFTNAIVFIVLICQLIINKRKRNEKIIQIIILLINLPIAWLYFYLMFINPIKL
jgi:hypothetical protein